MPEILEVEMYRRLAETSAVGRTVECVVADDAWYLKSHAGPEVAALLTGRRLVAARRRGKLLLLDTADGGPVLGLRFGMSGRLIIDGQGAIESLLYSKAAPDGRYDRFALGFADGGVLRVSDPRRLGGVLIDPDEDRLGPDALTLTLSQLRRTLDGGKDPLKARLLDQARVAGIGNLLVDEALWRAGLSPRRPAGSLEARESRRLHVALARTLNQLGLRGGSHTGDLMGERHPGGRCPRDGAPLTRSTVGGRTSWWCPAHQR